MVNFSKMVKNNLKYNLYFLFYKGIVILFHKPGIGYRKHFGKVVPVIL